MTWPLSAVVFYPAPIFFPPLTHLSDRSPLDPGPSAKWYCFCSHTFGLKQENTCERALWVGQCYKSYLLYIRFHGVRMCKVAYSKFLKNRTRKKTQQHPNLSWVHWENAAQKHIKIPWHHNGPDEFLSADWEICLCPWGWGTCVLWRRREHLQSSKHPRECNQNFGLQTRGKLFDCLI